MEMKHSGQNREELHRAQADLRRYMSMEEDFWRQKAGMNGLRWEIRTQSSFTLMLLGVGTN